MSAIEIRHIETDELVHSIDTTGKSEQHIERAMNGLLINLNENCYLAEVEDPKRLDQE